MKNTEELEKKIKLAGKIRDSTWFTRQVAKKRVIIDGLEISEEVFTQFKICIKTIADIYENNWDIAFSLLRTNQKIYIVVKGIHILFPEVKISNSRQNSHNIKDLLVAIELSNSNNRRLKVSNIKGGRLYLTKAEFQSNYFHSHLSISFNSLDQYGKVPFLKTFCTGSGEINIYKSNINGDGLTESNFIPFAMQIMTLVNWESIEGTPYNYIDRIRLRASGGSFYYYDERRHGTGVYNKLVRYLQNLENTTPDVDIVLNATNTYEIVDNEKLQNLIHNLDFLEEEKRMYFCSLSSQQPEVYYEYGKIPGAINIPTISSDYIFRNELKPFIIEKGEDKKNKEQEVVYTLHPKVITYIKNNLEYELNKKRIRQGTIDKYRDQFSNARESVQSNPIPM